MGQLVERQIPTLFGGVSKQPRPVRKPNQHEVQDNALSDIFTGGAEKRPATQMVAKIAALDATKEYAVFPIDRDSTEQTFILATAGSILAYNTITGAARTVTIGDTKHYFTVELAGLDGTGIAEVDGADFEPNITFDASETTFDWGWQLSDATTGRFDVEGSIDGVTWNNIQTGIGGAGSGTFSTTIDAVATGDHNYIRFDITTGMAGPTDTLTIWATFKDTTYLTTDIAGPEDFAFVAVADNAFIVNKNVKARLKEADSGTVADTARTTAVGTPPAGLVAPTGSGNIFKIIDDADLFTTYFVQDDTTENLYVEVADPNAHNGFDGSSMPHKLVRGSDGNYTYSEATWEDRAAGDEELTEAPPFIGKEIKDIFFFRNRLGVLADEKTYQGRTGDVFNWWPKKAIEVLDTDPIDRAATTTDVNLLKHSQVYRKILFVTSDRAQFELSSEGAYTPTTATFDQSTRYPASPIAKPVGMADVLYFPSSSPDRTVVYEYFFEESSFANTAADVTKHVGDYVPVDVMQMAADTQTGTLFMLTTGEQNSLYVYRTFFAGNEKLLSSWSRYILGSSEATCLIHGIAVFSGFLVMLVERDDGFYIEQMPINREAKDTTMGYIPLIDQRETATGTYDSANDCTYWDPTWTHNDDAEVCLGPGFTNAGRRLTVNYPDSYLLTLATVLATETFILDDGTTSQTYTAHATTTTTANREFDISGSDTADAGELVTCINDATDGHPTISATDNGDGTITLHVDDPCDGTITAPTGTAITNATITAAEVNQRIAARDDHSAALSYMGRKYTKTIELNKLYMRERADDPAIITGRLQVRDITFQYQDTGYFKVQVTPLARSVDTYEFTGRTLGDDDNVVGAAAIDDFGSFRAQVLTNGETGKIEIINDTPFPSVIVAAAWRGFFNELSRQG